MRYPTGRRYVKTKLLKHNAKYKSKKTTVNGIEFDSIVEANYYAYLLRAGMRDGVDFKRQVRFTIFDAIKSDITAVKPRKRAYMTDFAFYTDGKLTHVVDVKGYKVLPLASLKMDMFTHKYKVPVYIARWNETKRRFDENMR